MIHMWRRRLLTGLLLALGYAVLLQPPIAVKAQTVPQGTLIYDAVSVTLLNTGSLPLDIYLLVFVREVSDQPVRFAASAWEVPTLQPGDCVHLRSESGVFELPAGCHRLRRWFYTARASVHFWQPSAGADSFRVVAGTTEIATCATGEGTCAFTLAERPRVRSLMLIYTADALYILNEAPEPAPVEQLRLCRRNGPELECVQPALEAVHFLDPGQCLALRSGPTSATRAPCEVVAETMMAFPIWVSRFTVISPVTASETTCPAAPADGTRRCIFPR
jgi:hypothetical protein